MPKKRRVKCECGRTMFLQPDSKRTDCMLCHRKTAVWANPSRQAADQGTEIVPAPPRAKMSTHEEVMGQLGSFVRQAVPGIGESGPCVQYQPESREFVALALGYGDRHAR